MSYEYLRYHYLRHVATCRSCRCGHWLASSGYRTSYSTVWDLCEDGERWLQEIAGLFG